MNTLTIAGRLTKDAELRYTGQGTAVLGFTVASDVGFGDRKHAIFVRCSDWRKANEALAPYLTKGLAVSVTGEFDLREYDANDGTKRTSAELRVDRIALQGSKSDPASSAPTAPPPPIPDRPDAPQGGFREPVAALDSPTDEGGPHDGFTEDDIPF